MQRTFNITWQFFIAIAGVGLCLVVLSLLGLRLYFNYNFNAYLAAQEQQRLQELAWVIADFYEVQRTEDESFTLTQLGDLQRGGARRLLAGLSMAQWREQGRSGPPAAGRFSFRNVSVYDSDGRLVSGREIDDGIRVEILVGESNTIGYLISPRPQGPMQPIDAVFQQQQLTALLVAAALAILSAGLAAAWLARRLRQRVVTLTQAARSLAAGDYQIRLDETGRDDLANLSKDINQLAKALQGAASQRRDFMADIAHELRTPLTILQAELEAIEDGIRPLTTEQLGLLQGQVRQLAQLVEDVYTLAQADVGSLSYRWQALDMTKWLQQLWPALSHQAHDVGLEATLESQTKPLWIRGDAERLTQLLQNLWSNSIRYTDVPGKIQIQLAYDNSVEAPAQMSHTRWMCLTIEDSSPGVPEQDFERIFERLYRVEQSRNRRFGGSGLGLALVKRITAAHQGQVYAQPSALGGLKVSVYLPLLTEV